MVVLDINKTYITFLSLEKNLLGKLKLKEYAVTDRGDGWEQSLEKVIKKKKIAFTIPEDEAFLIRFKIDNSQKDLETLIKSKVEQEMGAPFDSFIVDSGIHKDESTSEIITIGVKKSNLQKYYQIVQSADSKPVLILPQSYSNYRILKDGILEGEVILYIAQNEEITNFMFFDIRGPLLSFSEKTTQDLPKQTSKIISEFREKHGSGVNRVILGGNKGDKIDPLDFRREIQILSVKASDIVRDRLGKLGIKSSVQSDAVPYLFTSLGLGISSYENDSLNLLKKDALMNLEKEIMAEVKDRKSEEEPTGKDDKEEKPSEDSSAKTTGKRPTLKAEPVSNETENSEENAEETEDKKSSSHKTVSHTIASPDSHFRSSFAQDNESNGSRKKKALLFVIVAFLVAFIAGGALFYLGGTTQEDTSDEVEEEVTPTPTPEPQLERSDLTVQVLNGSGEEGKAGVVAELLEDLGYEDVDTGNADAFDYDETEIQLKEEVEEYEDLIRTDLEESYVVSTGFEELDEDEDYDVIIVIGQLSAEDEPEDEAEEDETEEEAEE